MTGLKFPRWRTLACAFALAISSAAWAGQSCSGTPLTGTVVRNALETALQTATVLNELQPKVALIARVGADISEYGLRYTHIGFVSREAPGQPWRITHLLNECGTATSALWHEGLGNFFLDDLFSFDSLIISLDTKTQDALWPLLHRPAALENMHSESYSMVAYPFSTAHQNSNQWVLELLAQAQGGEVINGRERAQAWLKANGYQGSTLKIGMFQRLFGRMFKANIAFDGQPPDRRAAGLIDVVTVDSMRTFMKSLHIEQAEQAVVAKNLIAAPVNKKTK